ncbi:MAG: diacylglycerol kinase family lipid kinase [Desulfuromonadales bacterium]|nr:diacylglycerol kinase family lipid kinase [Desulfuromonadales bacterium]
MRIKLIGNPVSGGDARPRIQAALAALRQQGTEVDLYLTGARGDAGKAAEQAFAQGYDRIVVAGGDGTLSEVVNGVASADLPIAFVPLGTVNVFALEAGIPKQLDAACALAVQGNSRRITLGKINNELFLLMASAGWDADAVAYVRPNVKRLVGRLAYVVSAMEVLLLHPPAPLELILPDGSRHGGFGVVVSNCRYYGGRYVVTPAASMFRDDLEVCLLRQGGRLAMLRFAATLLLKRSLRSPLVEFFTLSRAELQGSKVSVQVDGDAWGGLPVRFEAVPRAVSMVLPPAHE